MKSVTLRFNSIESLGSFVKTLEGGYYINTPKLSVKGTFSAADIERACNTFGAQEQESKAVEDYSTFLPNRP